MTDETNQDSPGRPSIDGYGGGGFRIAGEFHSGSLLILPDAVLAWTATAFADATPDNLKPVLDHDAVELLLIGTGERMEMIPAPLRTLCKSAGITVEPMDTGAAARTFNVLRAEDRRVAAALIAV